MKLLKQAVAVLGSVVLIAMMVALVMPKTAHAIVATLVRDVDQPARRPFTLSCSSSTTFNFISCTTATIPAGEEFVIENVEFDGQADPSTKVMEPLIQTTTAGSVVTHFLNPIFDDRLDQPNSALYKTVQAQRFYADPSTSILCQSETQFLVSPTLVGQLTCQLSGYTVSLP